MPCPIGAGFKPLFTAIGINIKAPPTVNVPDTVHRHQPFPTSVIVLVNPTVPLETPVVKSK